MRGTYLPECALVTSRVKDLGSAKKKGLKPVKLPSRQKVVWQSLRRSSSPLRERRRPICLVISDLNINAARGDSLAGEKYRGTTQRAIGDFYTGGARAVVFRNLPPEVVEMK